ncbi:hypothetical protein J4H86_18555 [Spiractinospora alimapuensis]|uniref:hypothetical protein n=1 Tax=Spiractinospora alimapuensis TaxID=2820884 RepID=UPI001F43ADB4|nr:hypothetical protein [Spiractinospora alimapuensis]QVQ50851.1 hypothetical protein J4H86_18555 [Spiractinospora alimapuensis]
MSTSDEDANEPGNRGVPDADTTESDAATGDARSGGTPTGENGDVDGTAEDAGVGADTDSDTDSGAGVGAAALPPPGRSTLAEACTAIGLLLLAALFFGAQPIQLLAELVGQQGGSQLAVVNNLVLGNGLLAALAAVFGVVALATRRATTAPWVSWAATALVVVGVLFLVVSFVSFPLVPTEQAPVVPPIQQ